MVSPTFVAVAVLLFSVAQHKVHSQEEQSSSIAARFEALPPNLISRLFVRVVQERESVNLTSTGDEARRILVPAGSSILYNGATQILVVTNGIVTLPVSRYQYVLQVAETNPFRFQEFTTTNNPLPGQSGPGTLFYDGETALFTNSPVLLGFIDGFDLPTPVVPPPQAEITIVRRGDQLVLNVDTSPDGTDENTDDVIELTGSRDFFPESSESLTYFGNTLRLRKGSVTQIVFDDIVTLYVLEDVDGGRRVRQFNTESGTVFPGPGGLLVGEFQGQQVACFSTSPSANQQIFSEIVNRQLAFDSQPEFNAAQVSDIFTVEGSSRTLVELVGATTASFPTATVVRYNNGEAIVEDRFGQRLGRYTGLSEFNAFINNEITTTGAVGSRDYTIPSGGVTLIRNGGQAFIYPSRNQFINAGISQALSNVVPTQPESVSYSLRGLPDGGGLLLGNRQEIVSVTSGSNIDLGATQSFSYDGTTLSVFNQGTPNAPFATFTVNTLTVNESPGTQLTFNSSNPLTRDISGPGRLYVDDQNRAFFTNSENLQSTITRFVNTLPPARIRTVVRTVVNQTSQVDLVNGNNRLLEVSTSTSTRRTANQAFIYTNNEVQPLNAELVPSSYSVRYVPDPDDPSAGRGYIVIVRPDGTIAFRSGIVPFIVIQDTTVIQTPSVNTTYPGGGTIVVGPNGILYNYNTQTPGLVTPELIVTLDDNGFFTEPAIENVTEVSVFDGRRVSRFFGSADSFLFGPGVLYRAGSQAFYSTDTDFNTEIGARVGRILPVTFTSTGIGGIEIISGGGISVFNFTVSNIRIGSTSRTGTIRFSNGVLYAPTVFGQNITGITELTVFNGFETFTFGPGDTFSFTGEAQVIVDQDTGEILVTTDRTTSSRILQRITNTRNTFTRANIVSPPTSTLTSKFNNVDASFGQLVTVYQGATVNLRCRTSGHPPPTFSFFQNGTPINVTDPKFTITRESEFAYVLTINGVSSDDATRYTCRAMNDAGSDLAFADLRVRPAEPPMIVNTFFPVFPDRPGITVTATTPGSSRRVLIGNPESMIPLAPGAPLVRIANIACKAEGLPKAMIVWTAEDSEGNELPINQSHAFVPREGRSILTVEFNPSDTRFITYNCRATNEAGEVNGQVTLQTEAYQCETRIPRGGCSATCGVGLQESIPSGCTLERNEAFTNVDFDDIPAGVFNSEFTLCFPGPACPVRTFDFVPMEFEECSRPCGCGIQRRNISCFGFLDGIMDAETSIQDCLDAGLEMPIQEQTCNNFDCPRWVVGDWSPCSSTCAGGTRQRDVTCMQLLDVMNGTEVVVDEEGNPVTNDTVVDDSFCLEAMPRRMENCNIQIPCPHRWFPRPWGPCGSDFCQQRVVVCTRYDPSDPDEVWELDPSMCLGTPPHNVRHCGGGVCVVGHWNAPPFSMSPCSVTCGVGLQTRPVTCLSNADPSQSISEGFCPPGERPASSQRCVLFNCPGRCDSEPNHCPVMASLRLCKEPGLLPAAEACCRSCPLQATPIVLPPTAAINTVTASFDDQSYDYSVGQNLRVCCVAMSQDFLGVLLPCRITATNPPVFGDRTFTVEVGSGVTTACTDLPTSDLGLPADSSFNLQLSFNNMIDVANVTVSP